MSDSPKFDPDELLRKIEELINKNKNQNSGGGKSWISTLIIVVAVLAGIVVWTWLASRHNRELAKLRHEKNKAKILAEQAAVDKKIAEGDAKIAESEKVLEKAERRLQTIESDIRAEEKRYEADLSAILSIRSWREAGIR